MTILITGGCGMIGSNLADHILSTQYTDIVICDNFGSGEKWRNVTNLEIAEYIDPKNLFSWIEQQGDPGGKSAIDCIFHLGAVSSTTEKNADLVINTNFILSTGLWDTCALKKIPLIYASSAATYGDGSQGFDDNDSVEYLSKLRPLNLYGASKHMFDKYVARNVERGCHPPKWAGLKFFNVYGPNEAHKGEMASMVYQISQGARMFKDGEQKRDFIYVKDCADIMWWMFWEKRIKGIFNIGTGQARSFNELYYIYETARGGSQPPMYQDMPEALTKNYQNFTEAKMDKLRTAGYTKPFTSLEEGINDYGFATR